MSEDQKAGVFLTCMQMACECMFDAVQTAWQLYTDKTASSNRMMCIHRSRECAGCETACHCSVSCSLMNHRAVQAAYLHAIASAMLIGESGGCAGCLPVCHCSVSCSSMNRAGVIKTFHKKTYSNEEFKSVYKKGKCENLS